MGLSLGDLNPIKQFREGFESITGVSGARRGLAAANEAQQAAIREAISGLEAGGELASGTLTGGRDLSLSALQAGRGGALESIGAGRQGGISALQAGRGGALEAIRGQTGQAISTLDPLAGLFNPQEFSRGLTLGGLGQTLGEISDPSGAFADIFNQRQRSATSALSSAGLARSGRAAEAAANIDLETALGIAGGLFQRQASSPAIQAIRDISGLQSGLGTNIANIETGFGRDVSGIEERFGVGGANIETGFGRDVSGLESGFAGDIANLQLGEATNIANLVTGAGASEAQTLQAIGGLRGQAAAPFIEAGIGAATSFLPF